MPNPNANRDPAVDVIGAPLNVDVVASGRLTLIDLADNFCIEQAWFVWVEYDFDSDEGAYWPLAVDGVEIDERWGMSSLDGERIGWHCIVTLLEAKDPAGIMTDRWGERWERPKHEQRAIELDRDAAEARVFGVAA
jgi:hypothetical protein